MISTLGRYINNNTSETGLVVLNGISETGQDIIFEDVHSPLYSIATTGSIVILKTDNILGNGKVTLSSRSSIFASKLTKESNGNYYPTDYSFTIRENPLLTGERTYNLLYKYNTKYQRPLGIGVLGYKEYIAFDDMTSVASIVSTGVTRYNTAIKLAEPIQLVIDGISQIVIAYKLNSLINLCISSASETKTFTSFTSKYGGIFGGNKTKINISVSYDTLSSFVLGSDNNDLYLGGTGYSLKSNSQIILDGATIINRSVFLSRNVDIIFNDKCEQVFTQKGKRNYSLSKYPFINTNYLDEVAVYIGINRLPGETDNLFFARIKRLAKIKYGLNYETSVNSISEQLGHELIPMAVISSELPFKIDINDEYFTIDIFNQNGTKKDHISIFINIQNTINNNITIQSPATKIIDRLQDNTDIQLRIIDNSFIDIKREEIFRCRNYKNNNINIISNKRSNIEFTKKNAKILPGTIYNDSIYMRNEVSDLQSLKISGQYYFDKETSYIELMESSVSPFGISFIEYKNNFVIYKTNINLISITPYIKYGISDNFINITEQLLNNKTLAA